MGGLDFTGLIIVILVLGVLAGAGLALGLPLLWELIKPWLHTITG